LANLILTGLVAFSGSLTCFTAGVHAVRFCTGFGTLGTAMHFCVAARGIGERNGKYSEHHHRGDKKKLFHDFEIECLIINELLK